MKKILALTLIFVLLMSSACTKKPDQADKPVISNEDTETEVTDELTTDEETVTDQSETDESEADEPEIDAPQRNEEEQAPAPENDAPQRDEEEQTPAPENDEASKQESDTSTEQSNDKEPEQPTADDDKPKEKPPVDFEYSFLDNSVIIKSYSGTEKAVVIPSTIDGKPVVYIFAGAFSTLPITSVTIPDTVKIIEMNAFSNCDSLVDVSFGKGVTYIGEKAFYDCDALKKLTLPENLTELSLKTFSHCDSLEEVFIPKTLENWGQSAFTSNNKLHTIVFEDGIKMIGTNGRGYAFSNCNELKTVMFPSSVQAIGEFSFAECKSLTSVYFKGDAPTELGGNIFKCTALDTAELTIYYKASAKGWDTTEFKDECTLKEY